MNHQKTATMTNHTQTLIAIDVAKDSLDVPRRDNREESGVFDFTKIAGELGRGTVGV
jgi:hypothetical protein